jgi:hypothetical protein
MPVIIKGLNLTKNTVDAQLLTVPVYFVAAASYVIGARYSDKYQVRVLFAFEQALRSVSRSRKASAAERRTFAEHPS